MNENKMTEVIHRIGEAMKTLGCLQKTGKGPGVSVEVL